MKRETSLRITRYGLALLVGGGMALLVARNYGYSGDMPLLERYRVLCDAFTIPGVLLLMLGSLVFASNAGAMRGLVYTLKHLASRLIPGIGNREERYYEYIQRKEAKGKARGDGFLFVTGGAFMAAALVFLVLFNRLYG